MKVQNDKPMWLYVPTIRDYDQYVRESARVEGWNQAMEYIFGERIRKCWVHDSEGEWICETCDKKGGCLVYDDR